MDQIRREDEMYPPGGSLKRRLRGLVIFLIGAVTTILFSGVGSWRAVEGTPFYTIMTPFFMNMQPYIFTGGIVITITGFYLLLRG
jgi:hypothetical protein